MNKQELKDILKKAIKDKGKKNDHTNAAINDYIKMHKEHVYNLKVGDTEEIKRIVKLIIQNASLLERQTPNRSLLGMNDAARVSEMVKEITPYVKEIRRDIFKTEKPPFNNRSDAITWIEQQAELRSEEDRKKGQKFTEFYQRYQEMQKAGDIPIGKHVRFESDTLEYIGREYEVSEDDRIYYFFSVAGVNTQELLKLSEACTKISNYSGFKKAQVTMYILNGEIPMYPRYEFKLGAQYTELPNGQQLYRNYGELRINVTDIGKEEFLKGYEFFRKELNIKNKNRLRDKAKHIIEYINSLEEQPPEKKNRKGNGITEYWKKVLDGWNNSVENEERFKDWSSLQRAYNDAIEKIKYKGV